MVHIPSRAEFAFRALREQHRQFEIDAGEDPEKLPAWYLNLPARDSMRVRTISHRRQFVVFISYEGEVALVAPEAIVLTITYATREPRGPVGFAPPADGADDA